MKSYKPLLSIIIPVYNVEEYIGECLYSVLNQDYPHMEIIAVNDGSTDRSAGIIEKIGQQHASVRLFNKPNGGASSARNLGLEKATGDLVTFLDADDVLIGETLYSQVVRLFADDRELDVVQFDVIHKWKSSLEHKRRYPFKTYSSREEIAEGYLREHIHGSCCDKVFKRHIFNQIRFPETAICEDILIIPALVEQMSRLQATHIGYYGYRYREGSTSTSRFSSAKITNIVKAYYTYYAYTYRIAQLKPLSIERYTQLTWEYSSLMWKQHNNDLPSFLKNDIFLRIGGREWFAIAPKLNKSMLLKSFVICVLGPRKAIGLQRLFTRQ